METILQNASINLETPNPFSHQRPSTQQGLDWKGGLQLEHEAYRLRQKTKAARADVREKLFIQCGEALVQVAHRNCECPIPGTIQSPDGWDTGP